MKTISKLLVGINLIVGLSAMATPVRLAWDAPTNSTITGYALLIGSNAPVTVVPALPPPPGTVPTTIFTNTTRIDVGLAATRTLDIPPGRWYATVRAYNSVGESDNSNFLTLEVPEAPKNFRLVVIEATVDLSGNNWQQVGVFRLKLPEPSP